MPETILEKRFGGKRLDLGVCSVGLNLNIISVRGFAKLDEIASVSGPDTFNQVNNPEGTQRVLKSKHSAQALTYALESQDVLPEVDARAFPEVILSVRNLEVLEFYSPQDLAIYEQDSEFLDGLSTLGLVGVRVKLDKLRYPIHPYEPEISRVDGNHRLSAATLLIEDGGEDETSFPSVPFALNVGLSKPQERKIFTDINRYHEGMQPALLVTFAYAQLPDDAKFTDEHRATWLAMNLCNSGFAFENMVSFGGSSQEYKEKFGQNPPLNVNTVLSAVRFTLSSSSRIVPTFKADPDVMLELLNSFWLAVREVLPEAWNDKKGHVLLQSIGLMSLAKLAGTIIDDAIHEGKQDPKFFKPYIMAIRENVPLDKEVNKGLAGGAGQKTMYERLVLQTSKENIGKFKILLDREPAFGALENEFGTTE
jgi:DGQHR domain-containing protein